MCNLFVNSLNQETGTFNKNNEYVPSRFVRDDPQQNSTRHVLPIKDDDNVLQDIIEESLYEEDED